MNFQQAMAEIDEISEDQFRGAVTQEQRSRAREFLGEAERLAWKGPRSIHTQSAKGFPGQNVVDVVIIFNDDHDQSAHVHCHPDGSVTATVWRRVTTNRTGPDFSGKLVTELSALTGLGFSK